MAVKFLNGIDVEGSMNLHSSDIPNLDASKITSGTLSADRIPNLSGVYQPAGDYLTLETAETSFQPLGNYLTSVPSEYLTQTEGDARYLQSLPSHSHDTLTSTWQSINLDTLTKGDFNLGFEHFSSSSSGTKPPINDNANAVLHVGTHSGGYWHQLAFSSTEDMYYRATQSNSIGSWRKVWDSGNLTNVSQLTNDSGYLTSLPSHNHDTLYDAIGSADAVGQALTERIDTEVFDAINSKQAAGNYFTDGDTVLNMANNDGLVYNDSNNLMYIKADGNNYAIIDSRGGTVTGSINMTGGGTKLSMNNGDIVGVNQILINDPGEGIVWQNGSSGNMTLAIVDDSSDNRLNLAGTNASLSINNATVATQSWVGSQGYLTSLPSHNHDTLYDSLGSANAVATALNERIDTEVFDAIATVDGNIPTNNNQLTNGAGYITSYTETDTLNTVTSRGATTGNTITLTSSGNRFNGHHYFNAYDSAGNHYPHYTSGSGGAVVNTRVYRNASQWRLFVLNGKNGSISWDGNELATQSYVNTAVSNLVDSAPGALNTLNELAAALGDDANFSTTVTNNIGAIDTRINDEVMPYIGDVETTANAALPKAGGTMTGDLQWDTSAATTNTHAKITFGQSPNPDGSLNGLAQVANYGADGYGLLLHVGYGESDNGGIKITDDGVIVWGASDENVFTVIDEDSRTERFRIDNSGNITASGTLTASGYNKSNWDTAYGWGNHAGLYDAAGSASTAQANAIAHADNRIDSEIQPAIDTIGGLASTAHGWGDHASAGYLTSVPSALSVTSLAVGSTVTLTESTDRADLLMIKSSTSSWGGLQVSNTSNEIIFSLMGDGTTGGIYDDQNSDWLIQWTENAGVRLYHNAGQKLTTTSTGITVTGQVNATGGNSGNWNTAYGWGNHASAGYLTSIPSDYVRQAQDIVSGNIHPLGDREQLLGLDSNRWQIVFCEILDSAGQHEKNLQNPAGETSVADYATGTVMVWENGKNVPCTTYANHMRMGIAVENVDSPMIQGAEPVLVTGSVSEGDYLVTSTTTGHAVAVSRDTVKQEQLWDCVIGKALEGGEGESHLIKTWVTI